MAVMRGMSSKKHENFNKNSPSLQPKLSLELPTIKLSHDPHESSSAASALPPLTSSSFSLRKATKPTQSNGGGSEFSDGLKLPQMTQTVQADFKLEESSVPRYRRFKRL